MVNPEGVAYSLRPAGFIPRTLAYALDSIIIWIFLAVILALASAAGMDSGNWLIFLIAFAVNWFYFTIWEIFGRGATPGKLLFGLKVVADDGSPVSPGASFTRNLLRFADGFLGLYIIGILCSMFSPGFRRLGDWGASTLVVLVRPNRRLAGRINFPETILPRTSKTPLRGEEKALVLSFLKRCNLFGKDRADEIASRIVPAITSDSKDAANPGEYLIGLGLGLLEKDAGR